MCNVGIYTDLQQYSRLDRHLPGTEEMPNMVRSRAYQVVRSTGVAHMSIACGH